MDVTRGDRVLWYGVEAEVLADPDDHNWVPIRTKGGRNHMPLVRDLSPVPPEVVTLTLSYRGHEVSEAVRVDRWRYWTESFFLKDEVLSRAARALAEKVDADD